MVSDRYALRSPDARFAHCTVQYVLLCTYCTVNLASGWVCVSFGWFGGLSLYTLANRYGALAVPVRFSASNGGP
mgnify:CR=1 FL=1